MRLISVLCFFLIIVFYPNAHANETIEIGHIEEGSPVLTYENATNMLEDMCDNGTVINAAEIIEFSGRYYLSGTGTLNDNHKKVAFELDKDGSILQTTTFKIVDLHSCCGDNCQSCEYTRNTAGKISGCKCSEGGTICEHSILQVIVKNK